jgi:hypothetical protein
MEGRQGQYGVASVHAVRMLNRKREEVSVPANPPAIIVHCKRLNLFLRLALRENAIRNVTRKLGKIPIPQVFDFCRFSIRTLENPG